MRIVNHIRMFRKVCHMSQDELSQKTGISQNSISNLELGKYQPTLKNAFLIANAFGVPLEDIFELRQK